MEIQAVDFGEALIGGKFYDGDVLVGWDGDVEVWEKNHVFAVDELIRVLKRYPKLETLIIGRGMIGTVMLDPRVRELLEDKQVMLLLEKTEYAAEIFNAFAARGKRVVALLHTTL